MKSITSKSIEYDATELPDIENNQYAIYHRNSKVKCNNRKSNPKINERFSQISKLEFDAKISMEENSEKDLNDLLISGIIEIPEKDYHKSHENNSNIKTFGYNIPIREETKDDSDILNTNIDDNIKSDSMSNKHDLNSSYSFNYDKDYELEIDPDKKIAQQIETKPMNIVTVYSGIENIAESKLNEYKLRHQNSLDWLCEYSGDNHHKAIFEEYEEITDNKEKILSENNSNNQNSSREMNKKIISTNNVKKNTNKNNEDHNVEMNHISLQKKESDGRNIDDRLERKFNAQNNALKLIKLPMDRKISCNSFESGDINQSI